MRLILSLCYIFGPMCVAVAHPLAGDAGLANQLAHQILSPHHVPLILMVLVTAVIVCRKAITACRS